MEREKSCGAVVFTEEDSRMKVLVIRQNQGHWCFPKGHVEENETEEQTAYREIREETGLEVEFIEGFKEKTKYSPRDGVKKEVVYFIANPVGGELKVQEDELSEVRWTSIAEASALVTYDNDLQLLKKAVKYLKRFGDRMEAIL